MNVVAQLLYPPTVITAAVLLSRRWPRPMRLTSRSLAAVNGLVLLIIIATGWLHRAGPVAMAHRWLPHALFILDWSAVPLAIGIVSAHPGRRPVATAARAVGLLILWATLFLASITGYLGPSHGQTDSMSFRRFQVLHYGVWPVLAIALVFWWYRSPTAQDTALRRGTPEL